MLFQHDNQNNQSVYFIDKMNLAMQAYLLIFFICGKDFAYSKIMYHGISFWIIICKILSIGYRELRWKEEVAVGDHREQKFQKMFTELTGYEKKGVFMVMNGLPASPMQIVQAHIMREDAVYMRDYVLNDKGDIKELCFHDVKV